MNTEEIKKQLEGLSKKDKNESSSSVLSNILTLVESAEKDVQIINARKAAQKEMEAKLEAVERALSAQTKQLRDDLADLKTLQKGVIATVVIAATIVVSFILAQ